MLDSDFKFIEKLLYEYKTYESAIKLKEDELDEILPSASTSVVIIDHNTKNIQVDSQPEKWTVKRNESLRAKKLISDIRELKRHKAAVEAAIEGLSEKECQFVFLKYRERKQDHQVYKGLGMSRRNYQRFKWQTIAWIGKFLGIN